jgi:hypothetical protein
MTMVAATGSLNMLTPKKEADNKKMSHYLP